MFCGVFDRNSCRLSKLADGFSETNVFSPADDEFVCFMVVVVDDEG